MLFQNILAAQYTKHKKEDNNNICTKCDNSYLKKKLDATELRGCSETFETITILSNRLKSILNKVHIHKVQHPRGRGLDYLTVIFNCYGAIAFR